MYELTDTMFVEEEWRSVVELQYSRETKGETSHEKPQQEHGFPAKDQMRAAKGRPGRGSTDFRLSSDNKRVHTILRDPIELPAQLPRIQIVPELAGCCGPSPRNQVGCKGYLQQSR